MRAEVPVVLREVVPDLEKLDKRLVQHLFSVEVETLPGDLPTEIAVNASNMVELDDEVKVRDLEVSGQVDLLTDGDLLVARVEPVRVTAAELETAGEELPSGGEATEESPSPSSGD